MEENKTRNSQTEERNDANNADNGKSGKRVWEKLAPLVHLWPAVLVVTLIVGTLPSTTPVLKEIPELLTIDSQALETTEAEEESEAETESAVQGNFEDGVYQGTGTGYGGTITVEVTVEKGSIVRVEILSAPGETSSFFNRAKAVIDSVIAYQTWEVDVVSGATYSSKGILAAIQNALTGEKVESETAPVTETQELVEEAFEEPEGYTDGTYYGSARGFGGNIQVKVVISDGKIADISIVSASGETSSYLASAKAVINRMLAAQSPNVDTVSGATYSSTGIINAVKIALSQAAGSSVSDDLTIDELTGEENPSGNSNANGNSGVSKKPVVIENPIASEDGSADGYVDGVYTGTAEGFGGDITVQVTISDGKISKLEILSAEDETPSFLKQAEAVIDRIIAAQSPAVDSVSGATYSSTGIMNAVYEALLKALPADSEKAPEQVQEPEAGSENSDSGNGGNGETGNNSGNSNSNNNNNGTGSNGSAGNSNGNTTTTPEGSNTDNSNTGTEGTETPGGDNSEISGKYTDGIYYGEAYCSDAENDNDILIRNFMFSYTVQAMVTIQNGEITDIQMTKINDNSDDPDDNITYMDYAMNGRIRKKVWYEGVINQILTAKSAEKVDVVSGATYSSYAIQAAVQAALNQAAAIQPEETGAEETSGNLEETVPVLVQPLESTEVQETAGGETQTVDSVETQAVNSVETQAVDSGEIQTLDNAGNGGLE